MAYFHAHHKGIIFHFWVRYPLTVSYIQLGFSVVSSSRLFLQQFCQLLFRVCCIIFSFHLKISLFSTICSILLLSFLKYIIFSKPTSRKIPSLKRLPENPGYAHWEGFRLDSVMSLSTPKPQEKPSQKPVSGEETETATGELLKAQHGGACEVKTARQPIPRKPPHFYCLSAELQGMLTVITE